MTDLPLKSVADLSATELEACTSALKQLARALVRDESTADDLVQEAMGTALQRSTSVQHVLSYMKGMVRKLALRQREHDRSRELREREHARPEAFSEALPSDRELADDVEVMRAMLAALEDLPAEQRRAVSLRYLHGIKAVDIARREGKESATVRALVSRGLARMREQLDRDHGGRKVWSGLLIAFSAAASAGTAGTALGASSHATSKGALGRTLFDLTGPILMSTSTKLVLVPVLVAGLWLTYQLTREAPTSMEERDPLRSAEVSLLDEKPSRDEERRAETRRELVPEVTRTVKAATPRSIPEGSVVDAHTGDPLPHLRFRLASLAATNSAVDLETNRSGEFLAESSILHGDLAFTGLDSEEWGMPAGLSRSLPPVPFPFDGPLEVEVGPTFFFTPSLPGDTQPSDFTVTLSTPDDSRRFRLSASLRDGESPWTRFPFHHLLPLMEPPLRLSVVDAAGYWVAEAEAPRALGVEATPLSLDFVQTGAVRFRLDAPFTNGMLLQSVEFRPEEGGDLRRIWLRDSNGENATGSGIARHLKPGRYAWSSRGLTEEPQTGTVTVIPGETVEVELSVPLDLPTFDVEIPVVTSADDLDLSDWAVMIRDIEGSLHGLYGTIERVPSAAPGKWRIVFEDLPARVWSVIPSSPRATTVVEPASIRVRPGEARPGFRIVELGSFDPVEIEVVSDASGEPLPLARAALYTRPSTGEPIHRGPKGRLHAVGMPRDSESEVFAIAPGYRMTVARHRPSRDGGRLVLRLEEGWSNHVNVWNRTRAEKLQGVPVFVDGELAGHTDENGRLWLEGETPPDSITIDPGDLELAVDPMEGDLEEVLGSPFGIAFGLREPR